MKLTYSLMSVLLVILTIVSTGHAYDIPANVKAFSNHIKNGQCTVGEVLKSGFYSVGRGPKTFAYCKDDKTGVIYLHGTGSKLADMDIDCDGDQSDHGDGRCGESQDTQSQIASKDLVRKYSKKTDSPVSDVNANFIPYVVFDNEGTKEGFTNFDPEDFGMQPLSVMAVLCNNKLVSNDTVI